MKNAFKILAIMKNAFKTLPWPKIAPRTEAAKL